MAKALHATTGMGLPAVLLRVRGVWGRGKAWLALLTVGWQLQLRLPCCAHLDAAAAAAAAAAA